MIVLGIDPGKSGGLAIIAGLPMQKPRIIDCIDVPTDDDGVDALAVISFIQQNPPDLAYIERVSPMPSLPENSKGGRRQGMGATSAFNFGGAVFTLRTCVIGLGLRLVRIEPTQWKKFHGLSKLVDPANGARLEQRKVKEAGRQRALALFTNGAAYFPNIGHHNRAEAALIAAYGAASS